jgi:hypothetical protein
MTPAAEALFLLAACAADEEQCMAQREEFAKAEAQIAQQDDARCKSYGRPGSAAYIDCRTSLKNDRADMNEHVTELRPRNIINGILSASHRCTVARCAGKVWEMELSLPPFPALAPAVCGRAWPSLSPRRWPRAGITRSTALRFAPMSQQRRKRGIHQRALGRSRGGFTSKIHCLGDARGRPISFDLTPGEAADCKSYDTLISSCRSGRQ